MAEAGVPNLKRFCVCIIEYLSSQAIDPHLYFQQQMTGEVAQTDSDDDLIELMRRLISWVDTMASRPVQRDRLEAILSDQGFPPLAVVRTTENGDVIERFAGRD